MSKQHTSHFCCCSAKQGVVAADHHGVCTSLAGIFGLCVACPIGIIPTDVRCHQYSLPIPINPVFPQYSVCLHSRYNSSVVVVVFVMPLPRYSLCP